MPSDPKGNCKMQKKFVVSLLPFLLVACGGGGTSNRSEVPPILSQEDSASEKSLQQLQSEYAQYASEFYSGSNAPADLEAGVVEDVLALFFGNDSSPIFVEDSLPVSQSSGQQFLALRMKQSVESGQFFSEPVESELELFAVDVNEVEPCDSGQGTIQLSGSLNDDETGALDVRFSECEFSGVTFTGDGAIYLGNSEEYLFLNRVEYSVGDVQGIMSGFYSAPSNSVQLWNLATYDQSSNAYHWYEDMQIDVQNLRQVEFNGRVHHGEHGVVEINTIEVFDRRDSAGLEFFSGSMEVTSQDGSAAKIEASQYGVKVFFKNSEDLDYSIGLARSNGRLDGLSSGDLVDIQLVNFAPIIETLSIDIGYAEGSFDEGSTLAFADIEVLDPEGADLETTYRWLINGNLVESDGFVSEGVSDLDHFFREFPVGIAFQGDQLSIEITASDGLDDVNSRVSVEVPNAPGQVDLSTVPQLFEYAATSSFLPFVEDIDVQGGQAVPLLVKGPQGLTQSPDGLVSWDSSLLKNRHMALEYPATFLIPDTGEEEIIWLTTYSEGERQMQSSSATRLANDLSQIVTGNWTDPEKQSALLYSRNSAPQVLSIGLDDSEIVAEWEYPYQRGEGLHWNTNGTPIYFHQPEDSDIGSIYIARSNEVLYIENQRTPAVQLWPIGGAGLYELDSAIFGNFVGDASVDLAFNGRIGDQTGLFVVDLADGREYQINTPGSLVTSGQLDSDSYEDILLRVSADYRPDGIRSVVVDVETGEEVFLDYGDSYISSALVDVDGDGIDELAGFSFTGVDDFFIRQSVGDAEGVNLNWSDPAASSLLGGCIFSGVQIDIDISEELFMHCVDRDHLIYVYDADIEPPFQSAKIVVSDTLFPSTQLTVGSGSLSLDGAESAIVSAPGSIAVYDLLTEVELASVDTSYENSFLNPVLHFDGPDTDAVFLSGYDSSNYMHISTLSHTGGSSVSSEEFEYFGSSTKQDELYLIDLEKDGQTEIVLFGDSLRIWSYTEFLENAETIGDFNATPIRPGIFARDLNGDALPDLVLPYWTDSESSYSGWSGLVAQDLDDNQELWRIAIPRIRDFAEVFFDDGNIGLITASNSNRGVEVFSGLDDVPVMVASNDLGCSFVEASQEILDGAADYICISNNFEPGSSSTTVSVLDQGLQVVNSINLDQSATGSLLVEPSEDNPYLIVAVATGVNGTILNFINLTSLELEFRTLPLRGWVRSGHMVYGENPDTGIGYLAVGASEEVYGTESPGVMYLMPMFNN